MSFSLFRMCEGSLENFDTDLQVFYHDILSKELNLSNFKNVVGVKQALRDVVHAYKKETVDSNASKILFDSSKKRCAYVLKHCPCFTSAVAKHFFQLMRRNPGIFDHALHRQQINLCCLGGGPGTEAVAIAKVVCLLENSVLLRNGHKIHLKITEVDLSEDWKTTTELVLQTAQRNPVICDSGRVQISFELIKADLTKPLKEKVERVLHEADIITMVYFVSAVNGSEAQSRCVPMLQTIIELAKPGALLFFLDSAKKLHYDSIMDSLIEFQNMRMIHGPFIQEFHTLSIKSIKKFIELYFNRFSAFMCLTNCFITCVGLTKEACSVRSFRGKDIVVGNELFSNCSNFRITVNRKWKKMIEHNSRKQEIFRQRVEKLILCEMNLDFETGDREENDCKPDVDYEFRRKIFCAGKPKRKRIFLVL